MPLIQEEQQQAAEPSLLPAEETATPSRVPRNISEVAAQIALAVDDDERPFPERVGENSSALGAGGANALLGQVLSQELDNQVEAARKQAAAFASNLEPERTLFASKLAAQAEQARAELNVDNAPVKAQQAVASRALENVGYAYATRAFKDMGSFAGAVDVAAGDVAARNLLALEASKYDESASLWDKVKHFGSSMIPFVNDVGVARAVSKAIGSDFYLDKFGAIQEFRNYMMGLPTQQERDEVMGRLVKELSANPSVKADALRQIAELSKEDANLDMINNVLGVADIASLFTATATVARKGVPLRAVREVAGETEAGKIAAQDLLTKAGVGGLNDSELVSRVIAGGVSPFEADPAALKGINAGAQQALKDGWDNLLSSIKERLNSGAMKPEEVQEAAARIRASFMPASNKQVFHVEFGEASADGQQMQVFWQNMKGKPFSSQATAEKWAADNLAPGTYSIVPKNVLDEPAAFKQLTREEMEDIQREAAPQVMGGQSFSKEESRDLLRALSKGKQDVNRFFDSLAEGADEPFQIAMVDLFRGAARRGKPNISAKDALKAVVAQSPDEDTRLVAHTLLSREGIDWDRVPVGLRFAFGEEGAYAPAIDRVMLNAGTGFDSETVVHELVHAHNSQVLDIALKAPKLAKQVLTPEQIAASHELNDLWKRTKAHLDNQEWKRMAKEGSLYEKASASQLTFANENPAELLAWGITNPQVRKFLQETKLSQLGYTGNEQSVFSKLWELFKGVLGFRASDTAAAKLTSIYERFLNDITDETRTPYIRLQRTGKLNYKDVNDMVRADFTKKRTSAKAEWLVRQSRNDPLSYASIGKFDEKDIASMPWIAVDPKHGASELGIEARVVGVHAEAKVRKELTDFIAPYYKGLGKDGTERVRSLLEEGDSFSNGGSYGREWTYAEARAKGLTEREAEAYLATRQLRMALYHIRNGEMVRHMRAQGLKEIELVGTGFKTVGHVFDNEQAATYVEKYVYDASKKAMVKMDSAEMAAAYGGGKRIVRLVKPTEVDGELRTVMMVDDKFAKSRDISTALHYRPGEYSRIYSDEYFITMKRKGKVDGEPQQWNETVRTAASKREADEFVSNVKQAVGVLRNKGGAAHAEVERLVGNYFGTEEFIKAFDAGDFDDVVDFSYHFTRNKDEYLNGSVNEALANGRLFTSKRSERLLSTDAQRQNTLGVFESLEAEITSVSRVANISQWRESMVRRWMNTFGHLLPNPTGDNVADFFSAAGAKFTKNDKDSVFAERTHAYIMRQIGLRTAEERAYQEMTRRMTEHFFTGNERVETLGAKIRKMGVLGMVRNINFNLTLGMFNPAQLIVQANGAATAMILSPLHGLAAAKTFPLLRMALMSDNPQVWNFFAKADAALFGSSEEFVKLVKAVRQTGIIDNLKSTSLWNAEEGKLNIFGGYPSRVFGHNTAFFNRGEEFSRLVSFDVARREWIAAHAGADWTTKDALAAMVVRMDDLTQNMTKANLARFQEGLASIPLQFAQYNIKLATNIMTSLLGKGEGRGFTKVEATKLLVGHTLLYGAAGNGLVALMDEVLPKDVKESMPVDAKTYLAQGLLAGILNQAGEALFGERTNVALGSRLGVFNYYQQLAEAAYKDPKNIYEVLLGPSLSSARRLGTIGDVAALFMRDPDKSVEDVLLGLGRMTTEMASSLSNAAKAYLYLQHGNKLIDRNGVAVAQLTTPEVVAQALGFQPTAAVDVHSLIVSKRDHANAMKSIAEQVYKVQKDIMTARMRGDHAYADEQHKLLQALWPENTGDLMEVQRYVRDRLYPYDNDFQRLLGEYLYKGQTYDKPLVVTEQPRKQ